MNAAALIVFVGTMISVALVFFGVYAVIGRSRRQLIARLETVHTRFSRSPEAAIAQSVKRRQNQNTLLDKLASRLLPRPKLLAARLSRTGYEISLGRYGAICVTIALVFALIVVGLFGLPLIAGLFVGAAAGIGMPHIAVGYLANKRTNRFITLLPDAIDLIVRGLKSGLPVTECIEASAAEISDPVGTEFRNVADRVRFGVLLEDALWETAERLDIPEFKFFAISLSVQKETGGNLAETLANLSDILRRRKQMKLKIKAMSSEARASAYILGSMPFLMFGILFFVNNSYVMMLFSDPRGQIVAVIGLVLLVMGIGTMFKMVRFEI
jgi:tight adherence protein B